MGFLLTVPTICGFGRNFGALAGASAVFFERDLALTSAWVAPLLVSAVAGLASGVLGADDLGVGRGGGPMSLGFGAAGAAGSALGEVVLATGSALAPLLAGDSSGCAGVSFPRLGGDCNFGRSSFLAVEVG